MKQRLQLKQNKAFFSNFQKKFISEAEAIVDTTITNIEADASASAPVDAGFLRASINSEVKGLNGQVAVNAHYAPYIEFGTGGMVDVPAGLEDYAIRFKGAGIKQVNLPPRPFLFPAFKTNTIKMMESLEKIDGTK